MKQNHVSRIHCQKVTTLDIGQRHKRTFLPNTETISQKVLKIEGKNFFCLHRASPLPVPHGSLLGLLERRLQRLDPLHGGPEALLQLGQLAPQVGVVSHQLLVDLVDKKRKKKIRYKSVADRARIFH